MGGFAMSRVFALSLIVGLTSSGASWADISTADVNIVSVQGALTHSGFACTAVINNQNDDDSQGTKVIMLMPLQVKILRTSVSGGPGTCTKAPLLGGYNEYAICDLGQLPQGPNVRRTVEVISTRSTAGPNYPHTCSALIYSAVGDIQKNNNYMVAAPVP
jgi:hypothetical protein